MVIADTGYFAALANPKDHYHQRAIEASLSVNDDLITTWPVITETCHYLNKKIHPLAQVSLLEKIDLGLIEVELIRKEQVKRLGVLMKKYSDLPMDLADASLVILAEKLGHGRILSTDRRDFHSYRWKNREPFENLLISEHR